MNNLLTIAIGLDEIIKTFQEDLYDSLLSKTSGITIDGYGRVYKNPQKEGGAIPERWDEISREYKEMYLNSDRDLTFFYLENGSHTSEDGSYFIAPLKVVFIFNLDKINTPHRADAEVEKLVTSSIHVDTYVPFQITEIDREIESIFSGFDISKITFDNMQPYHVFSINGDLGYYLPKN